MEREYHEYPLGQFVSKAWTLRERRRDCGNDWFASYKVFFLLHFDQPLQDSLLFLIHHAENGFVEGVDDLPDRLFELIDFEKIGREARLAEGGVFTEDSGYVVRHQELKELEKLPDLIIHIHHLVDAGGKGQYRRPEGLVSVHHMQVKDVVQGQFLLLSFGRTILPRFEGPLTAEFTEDGYDYEEPEHLEGHELYQYEEQIAKALEDYRMPEEAERGIMHWYHEAERGRMRSLP